VQGLSGSRQSHGLLHPSYPSPPSNASHSSHMSSSVASTVSLASSSGDSDRDDEDIRMLRGLLLRTTENRVENAVSQIDMVSTWLQIVDEAARGVVTQAFMSEV
jgi:hypothetical protein